MGKIDTTVGELVSKIESGELRLPEMQRRYVWRATRVRDLLDSLYRGYPSGSILVWETDQEQPSRNLSVHQKQSPFSGHKLLLDGQQRLTSLSAVLRGEPVEVRGRKKPIDILFNLEHPDGPADFIEVEGDVESPLYDEDDEGDFDDEDESDSGLQERLRRATFVVASKALAAMPNWVSVSRVFTVEGDGEILKRAGVSGFDDPRYERYVARLKRLRSIREYQYVMHVLERNLSYEEVAEIFVRVNSLGVKLRGSDLALAQITARWPNSLKLLEEYQCQCEEQWFTFDLGLLVRAMVVFASGQCRFRSVGNISIERLQQGWEDAKRGIDFAVNFLRTNAGIEDESLLSSPVIVIAIAYLAHKRAFKLSHDEQRDALLWLLVANARARYSHGPTETLLDADLGTLSKGGSAHDLAESLRQQFGRLDFGPTDFALRHPRAPVFSLVYLALKARGAQDWFTGVGLSLKHQGKLHYIEYHHIFPKARLRDLYESREVNEIANMAFVSGSTNRALGSRVPSDYLSGVVAQRGERALTDQGVPLDPALHRVENYRRFLEHRRVELANAVNEFLLSKR
jgi:hypothetical protein